VRFVVTGEWTRNRLLKVIVWCFLLYTFTLWITNAGLFFSKMSLNPASIVDYYGGNEEKFMQPRSLLGLLEVLHFHGFAIGIMLLTLTHLLLFVPLSMKTKALGIGLSFFSAFANELSGWGVRFIHPGFAYSKIFFFVTLEGVLLFLMLAVGRALLFDQPSKYDESES
jgi:hypothetical protein